MSGNNFKDLLVWQKSRKLAVDIYQLTKELPDDEIFGISSQVKRSSISIASNIAEGYRRRSSKEFAHFLGISAGSAAELETQLILIEDIFGFKTGLLQEELIEIQKMLSVLTKKVSS